MNIGYTGSVRLPVQSFQRRGSNASSYSSGRVVAPPPTTLGRAETDGGAPAQAQAQAHKLDQDILASIRSPIPEASTISPSPTATTKIAVPSNTTLEVTEQEQGKDVPTTKVGPEDDDDVSVGAASARSFSSSSSSTSSDLLLADYPRFLPSEVRLGQVLGQGSFGIVREVLAFDIDDEPQVSTKGGYRSTRSFGSLERIIPNWPSSGRSIASAARSVASGGDVASKKSAEQAPSSVGGTSNDAVSRDAITIPTSVSGGSKNGSRDGAAYTAPLNNPKMGRRSSFRQPGDRTDDGKERRVSICVSEIDIDIDSDNDGYAGHHRNRKASLGSSLGSISPFLDECGDGHGKDESGDTKGKQPRAKKRDSVRSNHSGISSARSIAFGIEGRTFLARHCIREAGKSASNNSMRQVKSQKSFRSQKSRDSLVSHGSHESTGGSDSATRNRVLARLGLAPSISSSGGSRSFFKGKKKSLLKWRGEGDCRYAVKSLRNEVLGDPETLEMALLDLQNETRILANVEHPNIVKMRAFSAELDDDDKEGSCGTRKIKAKDGPVGYFIVLDRLYDTLDERIDAWSSRLQKSRRPTKWITRSKVEREVWEQRLVVAYDLAGALNYLHSMGIAYRDLVSTNSTKRDKCLYITMFVVARRIPS